MTKERAIGYLAATRLSAAQFSGVFSDEFCDALEWAIHLLQKTDNSPTDARKEGERTVITTEEVRAEIGRIKDCIDDLYDRVKRLESVVFYGGKKA